VCVCVCVCERERERERETSLLVFTIHFPIPGMDPNLVNKILDPHYLSKVSETFSNLSQTIQQNGPWASAWVGESGGAYNSGGRHVSDTFVNSFW